MGYWSTLGIPHTCFLFFALAFLTEVDRGMDPSIRHCQVCDSGDVSCNPGTTIPKTVAKRDRCRVSAYIYSELFAVPTPGTRGRSSLHSSEQGLLFVPFARTSTTQARAF